jgi:hypothetical protein
MIQNVIIGVLSFTTVYYYLRYVNLLKEAIAFGKSANEFAMAAVTHVAQLNGMLEALKVEVKRTPTSADSQSIN